MMADHCECGKKARVFVSIETESLAETEERSARKLPPAFDARGVPLCAPCYTRHAKTINRLGYGLPSAKEVAR